MNELDPTIKVGRRDAVNKTVSQVKKKSKVKTTAGKSLDRVSLSQTSKVQASLEPSAKTGADIRTDLINKFRNILNKGLYEVKADEIAEKIVQKIRDNKNQLLL